jgi:integrase
VASIHRRRGKHVVQWRDPDGKQHSRAFDSPADAKRFRSEIENELATGSYTDRAAARMTLCEYAGPWLESSTAEITTRVITVGGWANHIKPALGNTRLGELRTSQVQRFAAALSRKGLAAGTVRGIMHDLGACLTAAVNDRIIPANPCTGVKLPSVQKKKVVPWEADRVAAVRAGLPPRWQGTVDAGSGLGLRQGECFGLALDDIDFLHFTVHVRRQVRLVPGHATFAPPKELKEREVPLPERVSLLLAAHIAAYPPVEVTLPWRVADGKPHTARLIFTDGRGHVDRNRFNKAWRDARAAAGVPHTRDNGYHILRHTYASMLLAGGVDIRALSEYLGHDDPGFTLRVYGHLVKNAPERARAAIDAALAGSDLRKRA